MSEGIVCTGCGMTRQWNGFECLTDCRCSKPPVTDEDMNAFRNQCLDEQRKTIRQQRTDLTRLKAERAELRLCLRWVMEEISAKHPDMLRAYVAERARAVLKQTEPK